MGCMIQNDELRITFLEFVKSIPGMFCYKIKVEAFKNTEFKLENFKSPYGEILKSKETYMDNYKLLKNTTMKKDTEIEGLIAFYKNEFATLDPDVFYK